MRKLRVLALVAAMAAGAVQAQTPLTWRTIANNADLMPGSALTFSSFNQPSVNANGLVVFRARSKGSDAGGESASGVTYSTGNQHGDLGGSVDLVVTGYCRRGGRRARARHLHPRHVGLVRDDGDRRDHRARQDRAASPTTR